MVNAFTAGIGGDTDPTVRLMAYANLVRCLWDEISREPNLAPVLIAYIRGLRAFPDYRDTTVLLLEEIEITGKSNFDQLLKKEIVDLTDYLLEVANG